MQLIFLFDLDHLLDTGFPPESVRVITRLVRPEFDVDHHQLLMSTTPQGSTLNSEDITRSTNKTSNSISATEQDYIVLDGESDCRLTEAFDLPRPKKLKTASSVLGNGSELNIMSSNGNGTSPIEAMEHTNGGVNHNGVRSRCFSSFGNTSTKTDLVGRESRDFE